MVNEINFKNRIFKKINEDVELINLINFLGFVFQNMGNDVLVFDKYYDCEELNWLILDINNDFIELCGNNRSISLMINNDVVEIIVVIFNSNCQMSLRINKKHDKDMKDDESSNIYIRALNYDKVSSGKFVDMKICGEEVKYLECDNKVICNAYLNDVEKNIYEMYDNEKFGYIKKFIDYASGYNKYLKNVVRKEQKSNRRIKK